VATARGGARRRPHSAFMSHVICLDGEHSLPVSVQLASTGGEDRASTILALGLCPACPDTHLGPVARTGVRVCPCCWSAWWVESGTVACTPGAVVVEEPAATDRQRLSA